MLVVISDLHFTDGTTSNRDGDKDLFNIHPDAFRLFFSRLSEIIERAEDKGRKIPEVTLVFNGDIFDILRSDSWFDISKKYHPWAIPLDQDHVDKASYEILQKTVNHEYNEESLAWLSETHAKWADIWKVDSIINRIYIPGNHDRLINFYKPSRELVYEKLLDLPGSKKFKHHHMDPDHQTIVMHGHESDPYNCQYFKTGKPNYKAVPIGDPLTTMLFTRLGYLAQKDKKIPAKAKKRLRDIDNVRPSLSSIRYIQDIMRDHDIGKELNSTINTVVDEFKNLAFFKNWLEKHDKWTLPWNPDKADKLEYVLDTIKMLGVYNPSGRIERIESQLGSDNSCEKLAKRNLESLLGVGYRYCILGHTHEPIHKPISRDRNDSKIEKHYLNSGTFRTTFTQTFDKEDFLQHQRMSFVIVHGPGEFNAQENTPVYEMWSGLRMCH